MLVHRRGERGRAAALGQLALDGGDVADRGSVTAQLGRDGDGQETGVADVLERFVHPAAVAVVVGGVRLEDRRTGGGPLDEGAWFGSGRLLPAGCRWWWLVVGISVIVMTSTMKDDAGPNIRDHYATSTDSTT